jgi:hypothetical protein
MNHDISERTRENIARVKNLIEIYERTKNDARPHNTDILRAAVVFLHATLEDCLRSMAYARLPSASRDDLNKTGQKVLIGKLAEYRGKTVNELINDVVIEYLERKTYNNIDDISSALKSFSIVVQRGVISPLDIAIQRRHKIVHRADRGDKNGEPANITGIQSSHVSKWVSDVEGFVNTVLVAYENQYGKSL